MPETTEPQLTEAQVDEYEKRRYAAVRSYHSGDDVNWFLTVAIPALIRDWRAMNELVYVPKILPDDEPLTYRDYSDVLLRQKVEAQNEIRGVLEALGADAIHSHPDGGAEDIYESLAISVAKLQSQSAALREQLAQLANFASHADECEWWGAIPRTTCSCGLADIVEKIK